MTERPRLSPAIADIRRAVRESLARIFDASGFDKPGSGGPNFVEPGLVLVALSGGPDSLALAAALAFEAPRAGWTAGAVVVDHGLQSGSAAVAERAAEQARALGLDPVLVRRARVGRDGGPEAAARSARYAVLNAAAAEHGARRVLLGHTLDDQAETVLLGLARGSGSGSLRGMAHDTGCYLRPLLGLRRETTRIACADAGLEPWIDPQNADPRFSRVRVRERLLPALEAELGPGIAEALARTAEQLREESAALDEMMLEFIEEIVEPAEAGLAVSVSALAANPAALRQRIIRYVVHSEFGVSLSREHTLAALRLVTHWHGQSGIDLPRVRVERLGGRLVFTAAGAASEAAMDASAEPASTAEPASVARAETPNVDPEGH